MTIVLAGLVLLLLVAVVAQSVVILSIVAKVGQLSEKVDDHTRSLHEAFQVVRILLQRTETMMLNALPPSEPWVQDAIVLAAAKLTPEDLAALKSEAATAAFLQQRVEPLTDEPSQGRAKPVTDGDDQGRDW